jgi:FkbM family methyltransferase
MHPHFKYLVDLKKNGFEPSVIYDIGSCRMEWTNTAKYIWPNATIVMFDAFDKVEQMYKDSGLLYHIGVLSDINNKLVKFYQNDTMPTGNSYYREIGCKDNWFPVDKYREYTTVTLDSIVSQKNFPLPDLIKIDVQGSEMDVINGGKNTIKNAKHMVVEMQHTEYNEGAPKVDITLPFIEALGWKCTLPLFCNNGPDGDYAFENST